MANKLDKYIDLNQFPKNDKGKISWKNSIGVVAEFYYNGERHFIEILDYINADCINVKIDDLLPTNITIQKIRCLNFQDLLYKPDYIYNIGDIVNNVMIIDQLFIKSSYHYGRAKHYKCKCLKDNYEYIIPENQLTNCKGCPVCAGKRVLIGYNDLATTNPEVIKFLLDKHDGYKYTKGSHKQVELICPDCGTKKTMKVEDLVNNGFSCKKCSDGLSYPNKFAYNIFEQLHAQYITYEPEYSPDWIGQMRYDNYIVLNNGQKIIVEMDGGFHYNDYGKFAAKNDLIKDSLAEKHGIKVIRVNCYYNQIANRFKLIKNNFIDSLKQYFDLSYVDWTSADEAGASNKLVEVINYYNKHPFASKQQIADYFHLGLCTIRNYIVVGDELGLCKYIKGDINRSKTSKPLVIYDKNGNYIGAYASATQMANAFKDENFISGSISERVRAGKPYKGYTIKRITWDEYKSLKTAA